MRTIAVAGSNLFAVAAQELGDATQWYRIAVANGLLDPMVFGLVNLKIPLPLMTADVSDGLPAQ